MKAAGKKSAEQDTSKQREQHCPYIRNPFSTCYCLEMNSSKISRVVYYCRNHYRECHIYKQNLKEE